MDANSERRRAATASEAEWNRAADPEHAGANPFVLVDVQPDGALDLFGIEPNGSVEPRFVSDSLELFTPEASAIEPLGVPIVLEPSFDVAADAIAVRLAATDHPQPSPWPARRSDQMDLVLSDRPPLVPPGRSPVVKPAAWFASRRFWIAIAVVGLLAAAAVPGMAILGRSSASTPVQSASIAPDGATQPASTAIAGRPPAPVSEPSSTTSAPSRIEPQPDRQPASVRPSSIVGAVREPPLHASDPAATPSPATTRNITPPSAPQRKVPPAPTSERPAPVGPPGNRNVSPPPPGRSETAATTGLAAPAVALPQAPPAGAVFQAPPAPRPVAPSEVTPLAPPSAATQPGPSASSSSPTRLAPRAAAPTVDLPPVSPEAAPTLPPPAALPAAAPAAPAALPPRAAVAIPVARTDNDAIQATLGRYRTAFSGLDAGAAGAVWPSVDQKALERAFARLEHQKLTFTTCSIDVRGAQALATCRGTADYVPKVGNKSSRTDPRQWVFNLRKVDEQWLIETVNSR